MEWEYFHDESYFGMWCVRPKGEKRFGVGFHVSNGDEAETLKRALNRHKAKVDFTKEYGLREVDPEPAPADAMMKQREV